MAEADLALTTASPAETAEAPQEASKPEPQRDEQGRFTAAEQAAAQASPEAGTPAPASGEPQPTAEVAEGAPEAAETPEPFRYRADGQDFDIPGSDTGEDGAFIPTPALPEVQQLLAAGRFWLGGGQQRLAQAAQQVQASRQEVTAATERSQHVLGQLEGMIEQSQAALDTGDWAQITQSPIGQWLLNVGRSWPVLKAQAEARATEMRNTAEREQLKQYQERERWATMRPAMQQTLHQAVARFGTQQGLTPSVQTELERRLQTPEFERQIFVPAPYDDPINGIRQGETVINYGVVQNAVALAALGRSPSGAPSPAPAPVAAPPKPAPHAPPTVGKGGRAPAAKSALTAVQSRQQADDFLLTGDLSEFEE
jgi:hypothetical protein